MSRLSTRKYWVLACRQAAVGLSQSYMMFVHFALSSVTNKGEKLCPSTLSVRSELIIVYGPTTCTSVSGHIGYLCCIFYIVLHAEDGFFVFSFAAKQPRRPLLNDRQRTLLFSTLTNIKPINQGTATCTVCLVSDLRCVWLSLSRWKRAKKAQMNEQMIDWIVYRCNRRWSIESVKRERGADETMI